jgi:hypothetical protein
MLMYFLRSIIHTKIENAKKYRAAKGGSATLTEIFLIEKYLEVI